MAFLLKENMQSVREPLDSHGSCQPFSWDLSVSSRYRKYSSSSPASAGLTATSCKLAHLLRSGPITEPSTLLRDNPPLCPALVLSRLWVRHLRFSLIIKATGSHVPHKSLDQVHAISMPDAAQTVNRLPLDLSWRSPSTPVSTPSLIFRHLSNGSLALISLIPTWHGLCHAFALTLTTKALYQCSLRWFEACSCKPTSSPAPAGSSSVQLRTLYIKSALVAHLELSQLFQHCLIGGQMIYTNAERLGSPL